MNKKEYTLPNGKKAVFEYDITGVGKITLECMDELMAMIADRPRGEWIYTNNILRVCDEWECDQCGNISFEKTNFCDRCGARMKGANDNENSSR